MENMEPEEVGTGLEDILRMLGLDPDHVEVIRVDARDHQGPPDASETTRMHVLEAARYSLYMGARNTMLALGRDADDEDARRAFMSEVPDEFWRLLQAHVAGRLAKVLEKEVACCTERFKQIHTALVVHGGDLEAAVEDIIRSHQGEEDED